MNLNDFYVLVDTENNQVIDKIQELPENWKNISGLKSLEDKKLEDLRWAGHHNLGWVNIKSENIKKFSCNEENLTLNKNELKYLISKVRKEKQQEPITYKSAIIKTDTKTRYSLEILKNNDQINFKCVNGYFCFSSLEVKELCDMIDKKIQKYFDMEKSIYGQIDNCKSISNFFYISYDF
jgi:hypothetical protein